MALIITFQNDQTGDDRASNYRVQVRVNDQPPITSSRVCGHDRGDSWPALVAKLLQAIPDHQMSCGCFLYGPDAACTCGCCGRFVPKAHPWQAVHDQAIAAGGGPDPICPICRAEAGRIVHG